MTTPGVHDITIGGRGFNVDWDSNRFRGPASVPLLRNQADTSGRPGESALNPEDFWRRIITSWHHGAGQSMYDADDSDPFRFHESEGVDVWTRNQLSLLGTMDQVFIATNPQVMVAGAYLILLDADQIYRTPASTAPTGAGDFTPYTGGSANWLSMATDHTYIYATTGTNVFRWTMASAGYGAAWNTLDCTKLGYVRGRLMAAQTNTLYNIVSSTPPSALYTHPAANFVWTAFAETAGHIYASGYHENGSEIFKITIQDDGTALGAPAQAAIMPNGEQVLALYGYSGFLVLGTSLGIRLAQADANGFLTIGALIPVGAMYSAFGYGKYVWCGGAGNPPAMVRLDLETFTEPLAPAYANDLVCGAFVSPMVGVIRISTLVRYQDRIVAAVTNSPGLDNDAALFIEDPDTLVATGFVTSGDIRYGILDGKVATYLDVTTLPLTGGWETQIALDGDTTPATVGGTVTAGSVGLSLPISSGVNKDAEITIDLDTDLNGDGPTITGLMLRSYPAPSRVNVWEIPVLLAENYQDRSGGMEGRDVLSDLEFLIALAAPPDPSTVFTFGTTSWNAFVEDFAFVPEKPASRHEWNGVCVIKLKTHSEYVAE